jgi:hypothetical protein
MVLPHQKILDTVWEIIHYILTHNPPCTWSPITSCSIHVSMEGYIPISTQEMEILNLHTSHSLIMRTCEIGDLSKLSSTGNLDWMKSVHPNLNLIHL